MTERSRANRLIAALMGISPSGKEYIAKGNWRCSHAPEGREAHWWDIEVDADRYRQKLTCRQCGEIRVEPARWFDPDVLTLRLSRGAEQELEICSEDDDLEYDGLE